MSRRVTGLLLAALLSACGAAERSDANATGEVGRAPRKIKAEPSDSSDGPKKLSAEELKKMGIEPPPSKVHNRSARPAVPREACTPARHVVKPGRPTAVPLARPLTGSSFALDACVVGRQRVPARYIVDSGADNTSVDSASALKAGLDAKLQRGFVVDANGVKEQLRTSQPKVLQFWNLQMPQPELARGHALMGQDLLNQFQSWALDHDAGLLRLGMRPPADGYLTRAALKKLGSLPGNYIQIRIAGRSLLLKLDTGAFSTSISREVAESLRLPKRKGRPSTEITGGVHSRTIVRSSYEADIEIAGLVFEDVEVMPLPRGPTRRLNRVNVVGLLGADVLLRHNIVVRPQRDISFYERAPTGQTAAERIARWPWVPSCEDNLGCVSAKLGWSGNVTLTVEKNYPQAAEFLFGCVNGRGEVLDERPYLLLSHPNPKKGKVQYSAGLGRTRSRHSRGPSMGYRGCKKLQLIDVQAPEPGRTHRGARLVAGSRHWLK